MKALLIILLIGVSAVGASAQASIFFVAQNAAGTGDGSSCANARSVSWFNTSSSWGTATNQISPGSTVSLCGTISSNLNFQASGSNGNVITVDGTGAVMAASFNSNNKSYWRVQNVRWVDAFAGTLMAIVGGSNGTFIGNTANGVSGDPALFLAQGSALPSAITIRDNTIITTSADLGNTQMDIIKTEGSTNVVIEGNHLEMRAGGAGSNAHDDCIQTYEKGGTSLGGPSNWTIRYNQIVMNSAATNDRSWMMLENLSGTNNIYGNVFLGLRGADGANGISSSMNASSVVFNIFNNTFVAKGSASNNVINLASPGTAYLKNNVIHTVRQTALASSMTIVRDHNLWYGSNIPSCSGFTGELCGRDPMFVNYANNDFTLTAALAGVALASSYQQDLLGNTRGADGVWDLGAYEYTGAGAPLSSPSPTPLPTATPTSTPVATAMPAPTATPIASPLVTDETLLGSSAPVQVDANDGVTYELGLKFSAITAGQLKAIRFYKSPSETSTHTGKIYSSTGALLASVAFTNETSSGWQTANLATPLVIAANTTYTVSVNTGANFYVATNGDFAAAKSSTNLRAPIAAGVYGAVGAMPTKTWNNSNYFRDVVFVASSSAIPAPTSTPIATATPAPTATPIPSPTPTSSDAIAPSAEITAPVDGSRVTRNSTTTILASASDNIAVTKVEFYVNGVLKCTDTAQPYSCAWVVPRGRNVPYSLQVRAYDAAGNARSSAIVNVTSR